MAKSIDWEIGAIEIDILSDTSEDGFVINEDWFMKTTMDFREHEKEKKVHEKEALFL